MVKKYFINYPDIIQDEKAASLSFYHMGKSPILSKDILDELKKIAFETKQEVRLNLHMNSEAPLHNMIIVHWKDKYIRPHKHLTKSEVCHLIEGEQFFILFDEQGNVENCFLMNYKNSILKTDINQYHMSIPISEYVIFHEIKVGPFIRDEDSIFLRNTDFKDQKMIEIFKTKVIKNAKN